jgi:hypothetical protein
VPADGGTAAGVVPEEEIGEWQPVALVEQIVLAEPVGQAVLAEHIEVAEPVELGVEVVAVAAVVAAAEYQPLQQQAVRCGQWSPERTRLCDRMEQTLLSINEYGMVLYLNCFLFGNLITVMKSDKIQGSLRN